MEAGNRTCGDNINPGSRERPAHFSNGVLLIEHVIPRLELEEFPGGKLDARLCIFDGAGILRLLIYGDLFNILLFVFINVGSDFLRVKIRAAVVADNQFNVGVILLKNGIQAVIQQMALEVRQNNNGKKRGVFRRSEERRVGKECRL